MCWRESLPQFTPRAKKRKDCRRLPDVEPPEDPASLRCHKTSSWFCIASGLYWNCFLNLILTASVLVHIQASGALNLHCLSWH